MITHVGTKEIHTKRLLLRKFEESDAPAVFKNWAADEAIQTLYCEPVYPTLMDVQALLDQYIEKSKQTNYYRWAIISKEHNVCIGQIAYFLVDDNNHFAEIEYCIGSAFQRKGFASEATKAIISFGFESMHLHKVQICHKDSNLASKKVIQKCGLTYEGALRDYFYSNGEYADRLYYSILETEFRNR